MVNGGFPQALIYGFEMVDAPRPVRLCAAVAINRIFTPNQIIRIFSEFSSSLPQCKHLRFIDGC